ncbi:UNVERIFIED_CONTAM: hypothetical protein K2H54_045723 [Gekko kuhli]
MATIGDEEEIDLNLQIGELSYDQLKRFFVATFKEAFVTACKNLFKNPQELQIDDKNAGKEDMDQFISVPEEQQNSNQEKELMDKNPPTTQNMDQEMMTYRGHYVKDSIGLKLKKKTGKKTCFNLLSEKGTESKAR